MTDFKSDSVPNIWTLEDRDEEEQAKEKESEPHSEHKEPEAEKDAEAELEKPSFLRRLAKRYKNQDSDDEKK
jgi:hypothetical protein